MSNQLTPVIFPCLYCYFPHFSPATSPRPNQQQPRTGVNVSLIEREAAEGSENDAANHSRAANSPNYPHQGHHSQQLQGQMGNPNHAPLHGVKSSNPTQPVPLDLLLSATDKPAGESFMDFFTACAMRSSIHQNQTVILTLKIRI